MESRLIFVHRVQYRLQRNKNGNHTISFDWNIRNFAKPKLIKRFQVFVNEIRLRVKISFINSENTRAKAKKSFTNFLKQ